MDWDAAYNRHLARTVDPPVPASVLAHVQAVLDAVLAGEPLPEPLVRTEVCAIGLRSGA